MLLKSATSSDCDDAASARLRSSKWRLHRSRHCHVSCTLRPATAYRPICDYFLSFSRRSAACEHRGNGASTNQDNRARSFESCRVASCDVAEQQRIADCLSSLDDLIAAETEKLDALKTHKKGLMQQLFPSPEEVERMSATRHFPICPRWRSTSATELRDARSSSCSTPTTARARRGCRWRSRTSARATRRRTTARHALLQRLHRRPVLLGQRPEERPRAGAEDQRGLALLRRARRAGDGQPHPPAARPLRRLRLRDRLRPSGKSSFSREVRERRRRDETRRWKTSRSRAARRTSSSGASSSPSCSSCSTGPRPTSG